MGYVNKDVQTIICTRYQSATRKGTVCCTFSTFPLLEQINSRPKYFPLYLKFSLHIYNIIVTVTVIYSMREARSSFRRSSTITRY